MLEFIKMFGLGILYTILSPIILLFFLLFVLYTVGNYLICEVIYLCGFFMGKRFSELTALDKKLEKIKKEKMAEVNASNTLQKPNAETVIENSEGGDFHA